MDMGLKDEIVLPFRITLAGWPPSALLVECGPIDVVGGGVWQPRSIGSCCCWCWTLVGAVGPAVWSYGPGVEDAAAAAAAGEAAAGAEAADWLW